MLCLKVLVLLTFFSPATSLLCSKGPNCVSITKGSLNFEKSSSKAKPNWSGVQTKQGKKNMWMSTIKIKTLWIFNKYIVNFFFFFHVLEDHLIVITITKSVYPSKSFVGVKCWYAVI